MGSPCKPYGDPTLITHRDLQKLYTLNKYHFSIFIYYKETMKILVTHINYTLWEYLFVQYDKDTTSKKYKNAVF